MIILQQNWYSSITEFGTHLGFNVWDWSAVLISICSVMIAIGSLTVAFKTLKSQKKTEKNTTPLIDRNIQLFLLNNSLRELYESLISLTALYSALELTKYKIIPSKQFWNLTFIDTSNFHKELFYGDESKFRDFYYLISYIEKFNSDISDLRDCLSKSDINNSLKRTIILHTCEDIGDLVQLWIKTYEKSLELSKYEILSIIDINFIRCNHCKFNTIYNDDKELIKYYLSNSPFEKQVEEVINSIDNKLQKLVYLYSLDYKYKDFKSNVWHFVDLLLLNALYKDKPFAAHVLTETANVSNRNFIISKSNESLSNNTSFYNSEKNQPQKNKNYSWIFYFKDLI